MERHELSALFGNMSDDKYAELKSDVEANGFTDREILVLDDKVLDGWHRWRAATELNITDQLDIVQLSPSVDPVKYVVSKNIHRRHLNDDQRASAIVEANQYNLRNSGRYEISNNSERNVRNTQELADEARVNSARISRARGVSPEARQRVIDGESTLNSEHEVAVAERRAEREVEQERQATMDVTPPTPKPEPEPEPADSLNAFDIEPVQTQYSDSDPNHVPVVLSDFDYDSHMSRAMRGFRALRGTEATIADVKAILHHFVTFLRDTNNPRWERLSEGQRELLVGFEESFRHFFEWYIDLMKQKVLREIGYGREIFGTTNWRDLAEEVFSNVRNENTDSEE